MIEQKDAVQWLAGLPANYADLIVTDPAYESIEKHRRVGTTTRLKISDGSSNPWFPSFPNARFPELLRELYRVLKSNSHFYMFCDEETMFLVKPIAEEMGFRFWNFIVWDKQTMGMGYHYRKQKELILFFEKGKRRLNNLGIPDVLSCPRVPRGKRTDEFPTYPAEKPIEISQMLIKQSTKEGQLVIDPFMGSATVGMAAILEHRQFRGCDISARAMAYAAHYLDTAQLVMADKAA
jgi:site-specific DNA-methyltransferase (adenine-specific)